MGPDTRETRPLTDRAKEGIFSAIGDQVIDAAVLDLYAGSGSIGIEALSRGSRQATFVENNRKALAALRRNLASLGFAARAIVIDDNVATFLRSTTARYDLIFFDPPWELPGTIVNQELALAAGAASREIVVHRRHDAPVPEAPDGWSLQGTYRYGDSHLLRYAQQYGDETERF